METTRRGGGGGSKSAPARNYTKWEWLEFWGFKQNDQCITYKPVKGEENYPTYQVKVGPSLVAAGRVISHIRVEWGLHKWNAFVTAAEAAAMLQKFHVTVELYGQDNRNNPRYYFSWDLMNKPQLLDDAQENHVAGVDRASITAVANTFAAEMLKQFPAGM